MRRVVRNLTRADGGEGVKVRPLVWGGFQFFSPRRPLTDRRHPLMRLVDGYTRFAAAFARAWERIPRAWRRPFAWLRALVAALRRTVPRRSRGRALYLLQGAFAWLTVPLGIDPVRLRRGDVVVLADSTWNDPELLEALRRAQRRGVRVGVMIYDLFPYTLPDTCHPVTVAGFRAWFPRAAGLADFFVTISEATRAALMRHLGDGSAVPSASFQLGADLEPSARRVRDDAPALPRDLAGFVVLCVGTLEPRKNHAVLLDAFDSLAEGDPDVALLLIGRVGWSVGDLVDRLAGHPLLGTRLFHLSAASDATLAAAYARADALVCPSLDEGFGLPLMEGLAAGIPAIASDVPAFREVGGDACTYFPPDAPAVLADRLRALRLGDHPWASAEGRPPIARPPISWSESGRQFVARVRALVRTAHRGEVAEEADAPSDFSP